MAKLIKINGSGKWIAYTVGFLSMFGGGVAGYTTLTNRVTSNREMSDQNHLHLHEEVVKIHAEVKADKDANQMAHMAIMQAIAEIKER